MAAAVAPAHSARTRSSARSRRTRSASGTPRSISRVARARAARASASACCTPPSAPGCALAGWLFVAGIVLFSGSLYALALGAARGARRVTPLGGAAFLAGWLALAWAASR